MRRWHTLVIAFTLHCQSVLAQETGSVSGTVTQPNAETLPGVLVVAAGNALATPVTTTTSASGQYALPRVPPGEYVITFSLAERGTEKLTVQVRGQQDSVIDWSCSSASCRRSWSPRERCLRTFRRSRLQSRLSAAKASRTRVLPISRRSIGIRRTPLSISPPASQGHPRYSQRSFVESGQADFATNFEPGVGFYVDDVYYARTVGSVIDPLDIDRIEGTSEALRGRSSGAIPAAERSGS